MPTQTKSDTLGDHFKVSRGTVTGDRGFFVMSKADAKRRGLSEWAIPVITSTREFVRAQVLRDGPDRPVVIVIPADIDRGKYPAVDTWLGEREKTEDPIRPTGRRPWWSFGIKRPAAASTYKGEFGPRLIANPDHMVLLNVAYGLEPKAKMSAAEIEAFVRKFNEERRSTGDKTALSLTTGAVANATVE